MIKVLIADDHAHVRRLLRHILSEAPEMTTAAEATNGQEVLDLIRTVEVDIILLDLQMPGMSWRETLAALTRSRPHIPVVVVSSFPASQYAHGVRRAGAAGYLDKLYVPQTLVETVRTTVRRWHAYNGAPPRDDVVMQPAAPHVGT